MSEPIEKTTLAQEPKQMTITTTERAHANLQMPAHMTYGTQDPVYLKVDKRHEIFTILEKTKRLALKEEFLNVGAAAQLVWGFVPKNTYRIFDESMDSSTRGQCIFSAMEDSSTIARQMCPGGERPFDMYMTTKDECLADVPFMRLQRDFACTCFCLGRPVVEIKDYENAPMGEIVDAFACAYVLNIFDESCKPALVLEGNCCQLGNWCPCFDVDFSILDADSRNKIGSITKEVSLTGVLAGKENYVIEFEQAITGRLKAMVVAAALFLDMCYFTKGGQESRDHSLLGQIRKAKNGSD